ncbi:MAG: ferrous iron transport protein A [Desulfobacteraceae bacterium]|nr:ferrous iron transport protein A [Desulfobacteraceae bacterium]MBC2718120.1 ferrous iron transport protein A [Desulfobacteraceae bacterium]
METRLGDLDVGNKGKVIGFVKGATAYREKLLAMGLIRGTEFVVKRVAPLGDPVEINVRGFDLSLRKDEASAIMIEKER